MAEAIEVGTARRPLVLLLEDLHWSDHSTIELLAYLARRRQRARLLIVATYRPVDVVMGTHPLKTVKQELQARGHCEELRLVLTKEDIKEYVARRLPGSAASNGLAQEVYEHTDGNALFMVNVVEECIRQGVVVEEEGHWKVRGETAHVGIPDTLRQLIEKQVTQFSAEERQVLEVASVAGTEFAVAALTAALKQEMDVVEDICEELAWQGHFLQESGIAEWPDGTVSGRYVFRHALYQNVLYERIAEARRVRLHRLIGERTETGYGKQAKEIAAELAVHFKRGRDYPRAVQYLEQAGKNAIQRSAHQEAIIHLTKGLELLKTLPNTPERTQYELTLQVALGGPLIATKGLAAPEVEHTYGRALELCRQVGETSQLFPVRLGLRIFYTLRGQLRTARELGEQLLRQAQSGQGAAHLMEAHYALGVPLNLLGEFTLARTHLEQSLALYDPQQHQARIFLGSFLSYVAWVLWMLGYPDQALQRSHLALARARELAHPFHLATTLDSAAVLHELRREAPLVQE
jgi:predicted ATPase